MRRRWVSIAGATGPATAVESQMGEFDRANGDATRAKPSPIQLT